MKIRAVESLRRSNNRRVHWGNRFWAKDNQVVTRSRLLPAGSAARALRQTYTCVALASRPSPERHYLMSKATWEVVPL